MFSPLGKNNFNSTAEEPLATAAWDIGFILFLCQQAVSNWILISAPQLVRQLMRRCAEQFQFLARAIGDHGRASQFPLNVFISSEIYSADGFGRLVGGAPSPMKNLHTNNAPKAPEYADAYTPLTPGLLLRVFVAAFTEAHVPRDQRDAARELDMLLMLDPSAVDDLLDAAFPGRAPNVMTPAGIEFFVAGLVRIGAFETRDDAEAPGGMPLLTLRARPLLDLLRALPHRDPCLGIRRELLDDCTENETNNHQD